MYILWIILLTAISYIAGSVPFGILIGKGVKGIDIREVGSGNIGTANAIRALGPFWGGLVFVCDVLKGALAVLAAVWLPRWFPGMIPVPVQPFLHVFCGLASIIGHNNSMFLKFKGGKGIATSFGVFVSLEWKAALLSLIVYVIIVAITRLSSLGSLLGCVALPVLMIVFKCPVIYIVFAFTASAIAFYKHRENIKRLAKGEERKITEQSIDKRS